MNLKFKINGQKIQSDFSEVLVSDTVNYFGAVFDFQGEDWEGLIKYAHFRNGDIFYDIPLENDQFSEQVGLNLSKGIWSVHVHGDQYKDGHLEKRITTDHCPVTVKQSAQIKNHPFPSVKKDLTTDLLAKMEELEEQCRGLVSMHCGKDGTWELIYSDGSIEYVDSAAATNKSEILRIEDELFVASEIKAQQDANGRMIGWSNATLTQYGKNMLPHPYTKYPEVIHGITFSPQEDGGLHVFGTAEQAVIYQMEEIQVPKNQTYTYSFDHVSLLRGLAEGYLGGAWNASLGSFVGFNNERSVTFNSANNDFLRLYVVVAAGDTVDEVVYPQLEYGDEATEVECAGSKKYTVDFGEIVYGGTIVWNKGIVSVTHCLSEDGLQIVPLYPTRTISFDGKQIKSMGTSNTFYCNTGATSAAKNMQLLSFDGAETVNPLKYDLPILQLYGDVSGMSKDSEAVLSYVFAGRSGSCSVKYQGSSSLAYPKKNYSLFFDQAFEAKNGWGEQSKYCAKANYIDVTHARNLVSAKLWGQTVKSRANVLEQLCSMPNGGATDGFPIVIMLNGRFHGVYTLNIPKDSWMFGMDGKERQAIVCAATHAAATQFRAEATLEGDFEIVYAVDDGWVHDSLNDLINACINSDGTDLDTVVAQHLDWDSAIDYYIFTCLIGGADMIDKNYQLATYDGVKWFFSAYDMDSTYGLAWDGVSFDRASQAEPRLTSNYHRVMELIRLYKWGELTQRFEELISDIFAEDNVANEFYNFSAALPKPLLDADLSRWTSIPSSTANTVEQILNWYRMRLKTMKNWIENC